jgi:IS30 family transposase
VSAAVHKSSRHGLVPDHPCGDKMPSAPRDLAREEVAPGSAPTGPGAATSQGRRALTESECERIDQLHGTGLGAFRIGAELGRAPQTVQSYLYRAGLAAPKPLEKPSSYKRRDRTAHMFTDAEDTFIEALRIQDYTPAQIAMATNKRFKVQRCAGTIRIRLRMLAASTSSRWARPAAASPRSCECSSKGSSSTSARLHHRSEG